MIMKLISKRKKIHKNEALYIKKLIQLLKNTAEQSI